MNCTKGVHKNPFYIIFALIIFLLVVSVLFKPVMRWFYPVYYMDEIKNYSSVYEIDEHLVMAVISTESKFQKQAVSKRGAKGLMQLREETAAWCMEQFNIDANGRDIYNPDLNIQLGCAYLKYLTDKFGTSRQNALAAYNAGEGNVLKWLDGQKRETDIENVPFPETRGYIDSVNKKEKIYRFLY